jgi:hypothetical protein
MTFLDLLLVKIVSSCADKLNTVVPQRDANVLKNLANSISGTLFITENQSRLLVRVLNENKHFFPEFEAEISGHLAAPAWSRSFREIDQVKKLYVAEQGDDRHIVIEFTFSANIRKVLTQANKEIDNLVQADNGKVYYAELTERNIVKLVELLRPQDFDIEDTIIQYYDTIKSWDITEVKSKFMLTSMTSQNFVKQITADLGISTEIDKNIIHDRSIRYRYYTGETLEDDGTLVRKIATRGVNRIWIDRNKHTMTELVGALIALKRAPVMVVFDNWEDHKAVKVLEDLSEALEANNLDRSVGIYFRMPNNEHGLKFNAMIADKRYNQYLDVDTEVVGVQSGKTPKFLLTSAWRPKSVITIDNQFRSSKTAVYAANCCDLIVTYTDAPPIVETQEKWL